MSKHEEDEKIITSMARMNLSSNVHHLQNADFIQRINNLPETERLVAFHILVYQHSKNCRGCDSANCGKMKNIMNHKATCTESDCVLCKRTEKLFFIHRRVCENQVQQ